MQRRLVLPDDAAVKAVFGSDDCSKRTLRLRLRRAEKRGLLPPRVYISSQRFGYWADELAAKNAALPSNYAAVAGRVAGRQGGAAAHCLCGMQPALML